MAWERQRRLRYHSHHHRYWPKHIMVFKYSPLSRLHRTWDLLFSLSFSLFLSRRLRKRRERSRENTLEFLYFPPEKMMVVGKRPPSLPPLPSPPFFSLRRVQYFTRSGEEGNLEEVPPSFPSSTFTPFFPPFSQLDFLSPRRPSRPSLCTADINRSA